MRAIALSVSPTLARDRPSPYGIKGMLRPRSAGAFGEPDGGEGQALALRYKGGCCGPVARGPVPRARHGGARQAPVVRDRLIANRSRSGDLDLQRGAGHGGRRALPVSMRFR